MGAFFQKLLAKLPHNTRVLLWMVMLPLAVAAAGWWELSQYAAPDSRASAATEQARLAEVEAALARIRGNRYASITINGQSYGNPLATKKLEQLASQLREEAAGGGPLQPASLIRPAAMATMAFGVLAAIWGMAGMLGVRAAGWRALQSRDALMRAFGRWRRHLPRYLGVLLLLIVLAFLALTVARAGVAWEVFEHSSRVSRNEVKWQMAVLFFTALMAWGALTALWRLRRSMQPLDEPADVLGQVLTREQAPGLWAYVRDMAGRVGTEPPDHLVLGMEDSFYVTNAELVAMPARQRLTGRTLHLPLTYLTLLRRDEIDAIVAHEMGHFVGEDTAYSMQFSPLYTSMWNALHNVADGKEFDWGNAPAVTFGGYVLEHFDRAVKHWSRIRELAADSVSVRIAGASAAARALVHVTALAPVVHQRLGEIARRPHEAGSDLIGMLQESVQAQPLEEPDFNVEVATAHPHDTHPPTLDRLQAMGQPLDPALVQAALAAPEPQTLAWVRSLFADSDAVQHGLLADFKSTSQERNAIVRQQLDEIAALAQGSMDVRERSGMLWLFGGLGLVMLMIAVAVAAPMLTSAGPATRGGNGSGMVLAILGGAAFFLAFALWAWLRQKRMVMAFTPEGILFPDTPRPLSWGDIDDYRINEYNGSIFIQFMLTPEAQGPALAHSNYRRVRYNARKRTISVSMFGVKGMKNPHLYQRLADYLRGWHARRALSAM